MKKTNNVLISAKTQDLNGTISNAIYLEKLKVEGKEPKDVEQEAKRILSLEENDSIQAEAHEKIKVLNKKANLFTKVVGVLNDAQEIGFEGDLAGLEKLEEQLANELASLYSIEVESLYSESN